MKIVFLAPFGIRPKGTLVARMLPLAVELQARGHETVIVAPPYTNPEDSGRVETVGGVKIVNIALGPLHGPLAAPLLAWRMFARAMAERPDLVHLFKPKGYGGLAAILQTVLRRIGVRLPPLFVDCDDWEGKGGMNALHSYSPAERLVFGFQEEWLPPRAAGVTVASRTLQTKIWGTGFSPDNVLYLPNCVTPAPSGDGAGVREKLGIGADEPVLLLYTRFFEFSQEKLHFLFARIHERFPAVRFLVVGKGRNDEESLLLVAARKEGFADALVLGGWLEPATIPDYLAAADVAIYPFADTLINRSKCPAKLTEIMRAGVAVVADNVGQLAEYVRNGESGVLCDPDDWEEMAERAVELLSYPERRRQLGEGGRRRLREHFAWPQYAAALEEFYLRLLASSTPGESPQG
ncbi:MAG TPA: glycosyltransferase family 4 protein [Geobacteraceae bacterium]